MADMDGFLDLEKIPDTKGRVIASEVFGLARNVYDLRTLCRVIPSTKIQGQVRVGTNVKGHRKVPPMQRADVSSQSYKVVDFTCWKNVTHVAVPDESRLTLDIDVLRMNTEDAAGDLGRMEDLDVIDALAAGISVTNTVAGKDWSNASNEPSVDIGNAAAKISELSEGRYEPNIMIMRYSQYVRLASNPEAKKFIQNSTGFGEKAVTDRYFGLELRINHAVPDGEVYLIDSAAPALILIDGPAGARSWEDGAAFFTGYACAKWQYAEALLVAAEAKLTGVAP